jgi:glutamyl-tRNA synthetase
VTGLAREFFGRHGIGEEFLADPWFQSIVALEVERSRTFSEMLRNLNYFFVENVEFEEKGARKYLLNEGSQDLLTTLEREIAAGDFEAAALEARLRELAEKRGAKFGDVVHPLRLALTGRSASPGIFDVLVALGRERSIARIQAAKEWIKQKKELSGSTASAGGNP